MSQLANPSNRKALPMYWALLVERIFMMAI
jgi:hypothetical protein